MQSIYIHIPFCKQACHYCSFYFVLSTSKKQELIDAICKELSERSSESENQEISTIYFGGGTPSILSIKDFEQILNTIHQQYTLSSQAEISLESNPENLNLDYLQDLKQLGFNRISIGVQSFFDEDLSLMNRNHNGDQSKIAIQNAIQVFENVSIDLMFGLPYSGMNRWRENLEIATSFDIKHISTYNLTIEEKTALERKVKRNEIQVENDSTLNEMYYYTLDFLEAKGFVNYEISNFGKENYWSRHNLNYWNNTKFIGIGPSAHSYDGKDRRNNIANLNQYIESVAKSSQYWKVEHLTPENRYNEYILTRLRTILGVDIQEIQAKFGEQFSLHYQNNIQDFIANRQIIRSGNKFTLSREGKVLADWISSELMYM